MDEPLKYIRTDLAVETLAAAGAVAEIEKQKAEKSRDLDYNEEDSGGAHIVTLVVKNENGEKLAGKPTGKYITVSVGKIWYADDEKFESIASAVASQLKKLADAAAPGASNILVAGLGNREITADAVGPCCVDKINVTRHLKTQNAELFEKLASSEVSAVAPGVVGQTGIESSAIVKGAAEDVGPSLIIAVDALAARSTDRLATTIQLTDTGISPGSGIGNRRAALNSETLGVPVIAIGVPTVVDSSTLVYDALDKAGIEKIDDRLTQVLENGRSFFVSLKESDVATAELSRLIARAINIAFGNDYIQ